MHSSNMNKNCIKQFIWSINQQNATKASDCVRKKRVLTALPVGHPHEPECAVGGGAGQLPQLLAPQLCPGV